MNLRHPRAHRGVVHHAPDGPAHEPTSVLTGWDVRIGGLSCHIREADEFGLAAAIHRVLEPRIPGDFHVRLDLDPVTLKSNGAGSITRPDGRPLAAVSVRVRNRAPRPAGRAA